MLTLTREAFNTVGEVEFSLRNAASVHALSHPSCYHAVTATPTVFALTLGCHLLQSGFLFSLNSLAPVVTYQSGTRFAVFVLLAGTKRID